MDCYYKMSSFSLDDGKPQENATVEDFLNVDAPIPGQNFCCLSFLSPENVLKKKEVFFTEKFLEFLEIKTEENISEKYENFLHLKEKELEEEFHAHVGGKTSIRGLKIRGVYDTRKEADVRAQVLQRQDRSHNVYVCQVGYWCPWDPNPNNVESSEYLEKGLNDLMKSYKDNEIQRDMFYSEQVKQYKANVEEENRKAKENNEKEIQENLNNELNGHEEEKSL